MVVQVNVTGRKATTGTSKQVVVQSSAVTEAAMTSTGVKEMGVGLVRVRNFKGVEQRQGFIESAIRGKQAHFFEEVVSGVTGETGAGKGRNGCSEGGGTEEDVSA